MTTQLTKRQRSLIRLLYDRKQKMISNDVSIQLGVSTRTIRNDVRDINNAFHQSVILSDRDGYSLDQDVIDYGFFQQGYDDPSENRPERILQKLLIDGDGIDLDVLADMFYISKPRLEKDIRQAQEMLCDNYHLQLNRKQNKIYLEGEEKEKRRCISHFIYDEYSKNFMTTEKIQEYFPDVDVLYVNQVVNEQIEAYQMRFSKWLRLSLVLHFTIAVNWIEKNKRHPTASVCSEKKPTDRDLRFTLKIVECLERKFNIQFPKEEQRYIEYLVRGRNANPHSNQEQRRYFGRIIKHTCKLFQLDIQSKSVDMLSMHIENAVHRVQADTSTYNPYQNDIKEKSPMMYELAVRICERIHDDIGCVFDDNEIGFIALHLACALLHCRETKLNAGVFFPQYHAFKQNICMFLNDQLDQKINIIDMSNSIEGHEEDLDFIITPVQFLQTNLPVVLISIIPEQDDMEHIKAMIQRIEKKKASS